MAHAACNAFLPFVVDSGTSFFTPELAGAMAESRRALGVQEEWDAWARETSPSNAMDTSEAEVAFWIAITLNGGFSWVSILDAVVSSAREALTWHTWLGGDADARVSDDPGLVRALVDEALSIVEVPSGRTARRAAAQRNNYVWRILLVPEFLTVEARTLPSWLDEVEDKDLVARASQAIHEKGRIGDEIGGVIHSLASVWYCGLYFPSVVMPFLRRRPVPQQQGDAASSAADAAWRYDQHWLYRYSDADGFDSARLPSDVGEVGSKRAFPIRGGTTRPGETTSREILADFKSLVRVRTGAPPPNPRRSEPPAKSIAEVSYHSCRVSFPAGAYCCGIVPEHRRRAQVVR